MEKRNIIIASAVFIVLILGLAVWLQRLDGEKPTDTELLSSKGLHFHADFSLVVKGEPTTIPAGIGLSTTHNPIHTHDEPGVIHMEFPGIVRKGDLALGNFFRVWGKDMQSFGTNMKMTVNGVENTEFGNYQMKDKDKIVLTFE